MDKEPKSGGGLPGNGILAIVMVAAGVLFVREVPLQTTRPLVSEPRLEQAFAVQDIDARLWQDPFGAVAKGRVETQKKPEEKPDDPDRIRHSRQALSNEIQRKIDARQAALPERTKVPQPDGTETGAQRIEILAVMLPGGTYSESVESRRRTRYAVLNGLNASRMAPVDTEHIGYFYPDPASPEPEPAPAAAQANAQARALRPLPPPVPFEWFEPSIDVRQRSVDVLAPLVLVMWLPAESFADQPLARLRHLTGQFPMPSVYWRVLGPNGSDGLKAMVDEVAVLGPDRFTPATFPVRIYSQNATVPDDVLLSTLAQEDEPPDLSKFFKRRGVQLVRTIGDDNRLADTLRQELERRGLRSGNLTQAPEDGGSARNDCRSTRLQHVKTPSTIGLVAEWDTLYGRSLRRQFRASKDKLGFCVERFNYVRGLDGYLPTGGDAPSASASVVKQTQADKDGSRRNDGSFIEIAEGQSQFDYLRRMAMEMRAVDLEIRRTSVDHKGLLAIGVLGNDVYDKLLVLQALRPEFPNVLFFTTDMDARLLHPREQAWARNLIVGSSFGLKLDDVLQGGSPPFRSNYQTAAYFATRLAMDDARRMALPDGEGGQDRKPVSQHDIRQWLKVPRIFEIGRTMAFDYAGSVSSIDGSPDDPDDGGPAKKCGRQNWTRCLTDIHGPGSRTIPISEKRRWRGSSRC